MGLDGQTLMLVQYDKVERKLVLMFDIYTLDKITEMFVNTCNPSIAENYDYNKDIDYNHPVSVDSNRTDGFFPRISWWDSGNYILVGVGAAPLSVVYHEFRIYSSEKHKILGNFNRNSNPATGGILMSVYSNPHDTDGLVFLVRDNFTYTIVEADIIHNSSKEICSISSYEFAFVKIAEDLSWIFVGSRRDNTKNFE